MSDTPETDLECFIYEGDYVPASFARKLERERDELRAEVGRLKLACKKEFASVDLLSNEVERLKADKARLDWLEKAKSAEYCEGPRGWSLNGWSGPYSDTLRDAIDAMKGA